MLVLIRWFLLYDLEGSKENNVQVITTFISLQHLVHMFSISVPCVAFHVTLYIDLEKGSDLF